MDQNISSKEHTRAGVINRNGFVVRDDNVRVRSNEYIEESGVDIFQRELRLLNKSEITISDRDRVIRIVYRYFE